MRSSFGFSAPTPTVTKLLIIILATYLVFALLGRTGLGMSIYNALLLSPPSVVYSFEVWRIFTYAFLHDTTSPLHVILNALMLYMMGPPLEERWGEARFIVFVMTAIVLGGVLVSVSFLLGLGSSLVVGFSSATIGLVVAWGLTFSKFHIFLLGIVPITGMQLVYVTVGLEVLYAVSANSISSAAHFGGIIAGFIFSLGLYKPQRIKSLWQKNRRSLRH